MNRECPEDALGQLSTVVGAKDLFKERDSVSSGDLQPGDDARQENLVVQRKHRHCARNRDWGVAHHMRRVIVGGLWVVVVWSQQGGERAERKSMVNEEV
jgi:hypothetical protein